MSTRDTYNQGAAAAFGFIKGWLEKTGEAPRFAFPPKDIALIADLRDIGQRLARNESARRLVDELNEAVLQLTGQAPTAMMLRVILEELEQPIEWVAPSELGLKVPRS